MTKEEIKKELSDTLLNLGGLSFSDVNDLLEEDSAVTFEGKELIEIAKHFYNLPKKGLWGSEKVIKFIKKNVREYHKSGVFHIDDFIKDLRKAMEE